MQSLRKWVSGGRLATLVLLLGQLSAALGAVAVNILAARVLIPSDRGDLAFGLQIAYFLTVFATMGLERPYIASRDGEFYDEYRKFTILVLPGAILIIPLAILVVYISPLSPGWIGLGIASIVAYTVLNTISRGVRVGYVVSRNWKRFGFHALASQVLIVSGSLILVAFDVSRPEFWMLVYAVSTFPAILLLAMTFRGGSSAEPLNRTERRRIRRRGWVLLPSDFSNTAMMRSDRLLLPILGSAAELGLYVTVATVMEMASWPVKQWVDASLRQWANNGKNLTESMTRILFQAFLLIASMSLLLGIASYAMIYFILPAPYLAASGAIIPLAIGTIVFGLTRVQQGFLVAFGATGSVSIIEIVGTAASLIAFLALIPSFGMLGAAYGSIVGYATCYLLASIVLRRIKGDINEG